MCKMYNSVHFCIYSLFLNWIIPFYWQIICVDLMEELFWVVILF